MLLLMAVMHKHSTIINHTATHTTKRTQYAGLTYRLKLYIQSHHLNDEILAAVRYLYRNSDGSTQIQ